MRFTCPELETIDSLIRAGSFREARELSEARGTDPAGSPLPAAQHLYLRGKIFRNQGSYAEAEAEYLSAARSFSLLGEEESAADALSGAALVRWHLCDFPRATSLQLEALGAYRRLGDERGMANGENNLGLIAWKRKDLAEAIRRFEAALGLYEKLSHAQGLAATVNNLGGVREDEGELGRSEDYYRRAISYYGKAGDAAGAAMASGNLAWVLARSGKAAEASAFADRAIGDFKTLGDSAGLTRALMQRGQVLRASGRPREAAADLYRAAHGAKLVGNAELEAVTIEDLIEVLGELGLHERAGPWYRRLMRLEAAFLSREREREILRLGIDYEVESRKRRTEELEAEIDARGRLLAAVSHDSRAAMSRLREALDSLCFVFPSLGEGEARSRLLGLSVQAAEIQAGFEASMAWASAKGGSLQPELEELSLEAELGKALAAARRDLAARDMEAAIASGLAGAAVLADRRMLALILGNMIGNALEHGERGFPLRIGLESGAEGRPILEMRNRVPGGAPPSPRQARGAGSGPIHGLGLGICADFAHRMGGSFAFSIDEGEGRAVLVLARAKGDSPST